MINKRTDKKGFYFYVALNILALIVLSGITLRFLALRGEFLAVKERKVVLQDKSGLRYRIIPGEGEDSIMIVADLVGTNLLSSRGLAAKDPLPEIRSQKIIVTQVKPYPYQNVTEDNFLEMISTDKGIVLSDNFCVEGWDQLRDKELYQRTALSPGPFCFSEPQTMILDNLIKEHKVRKVILYYDVPAHLSFIQTFLSYLDQLKIEHELREITDIL